ncbi:MAG TPA: hypothetical protein VN661_04115 [Candidatus Acidoferrales bacterium]|nr:hypothetical protein [Candidatus Acidoferrales bacterium]
MSRRHSSLFVALMGVPLVGLALAHAPYSASAMGYSSRSTVWPSRQGVAALAEHPPTVPDAAEQSAYPEPGLSQANRVAPIGAVGSSDARSDSQNRGYQSSLFPMAALLALFATGGIVLLRRIARMIV